MFLLDWKITLERSFQNFELPSLFDFHLNHPKNRTKHLYTERLNYLTLMSNNMNFLNIQE